jgi:hypothetical protein
MQSSASHMQLPPQFFGDDQLLRDAQQKLSVSVMLLRLCTIFADVNLLRFHQGTSKKCAHIIFMRTLIMGSHSKYSLALALLPALLPSTLYLQMLHSHFNQSFCKIHISEEIFLKKQVNLLFSPIHYKLL